VRVFIVPGRDRQKMTESFRQHGIDKFRKADAEAKEKSQAFGIL
jgi:hypothetical protein